MEEAQIKQIIEHNPMALRSSTPLQRYFFLVCIGFCQLFSGRRSCQSRAHAGLWAVYCLG